MGCMILQEIGDGSQRYLSGIPDTRNQQPAASSQQPAASNQQPVARRSLVAVLLGINSASDFCLQKGGINKILRIFVNYVQH